ncbi:hypothetical protein FH972_024385 [Carpinus fangiana]|uniref:BTB domain-containing protein n=1 Tax=Carpinus fangiana TaxID=176857 RepID=A0A5N6KYT0_9ROSI|nr:hypothetical protein FH972_024385 [Carpinus fangiana]
MAHSSPAAKPLPYTLTELCRALSALSLDSMGNLALASRDFAQKLNNSSESRDVVDYDDENATIVVGSKGTEFTISRSQLGICSEFFSVMLHGDWQETWRGCVHLPQFEEEEVKLFISWLTCTRKNHEKVKAMVNSEQQVFEQEQMVKLAGFRQRRELMQHNRHFKPPHFVIHPSQSGLDNQDLSVMVKRETHDLSYDMMEHIRVCDEGYHGAWSRYAPSYAWYAGDIFQDPHHVPYVKFVRLYILAHYLAIEGLCFVIQEGLAQVLTCFKIRSPTARAECLAYHTVFEALKLAFHETAPGDKLQYILATYAARQWPRAAEAPELNEAINDWDEDVAEHFWIMYDLARETCDADSRDLLLHDLENLPLVRGQAFRLLVKSGLATAEELKRSFPVVTKDFFISWSNSEARNDHDSAHLSKCRRTDKVMTPSIAGHLHRMALEGPEPEPATTAWMPVEVYPREEFSQSEDAVYAWQPPAHPHECELRWCSATAFYRHLTEFRVTQYTRMMAEYLAPELTRRMERPAWQDEVRNIAYLRKLEVDKLKRHSVQYYPAQM